MPKTDISIEAEELQHCIDGLNMRICFIETGNPLLRATDVKNQFKADPCYHSSRRPPADFHDKINPLSDEQIKLLGTLINLRDKLQAVRSNLGYGG